LKTFQSRSGLFAKRPYYSDEEIERICLNELGAVALLPHSPGPIRIDRFIEKRFGISHQYEDLVDGVLGATVFSEQGIEAIVVARNLDEEGSKIAERRIRSTLGHEAGHGILHIHLFDSQRGNERLFGDFSDPLKPKVLCRDVVTSEEKPKAAYDGRWWEFQANSVMGALLLPRPLVELVLEPFMVAHGSLGGMKLDRTRREQAARHLSELFDTNPVVARLRLERLYPTENWTPLSL
jgi:hypothetical protein